ncbi:MAG TPA: hypothetical protein VIC26_03005 [Marinagarivorans sp.]
MKNDGHPLFPFDDEAGRCYTPEGKVLIDSACRGDLVELLPEEPTTRLVELEAKRAELDKEIGELNAVLTAPKVHFEHVVVDLPDGEMRVYTLTFTRGNDEWEPAFEIVPK